jgi:tRNA(Ile)-lysidine synthase
MQLLQQFQQNWKNDFSHLSNANCHLIIAVSGGIDSIVLTDLLHKSGFDFTIAHCNFKLRGEESERDELFARSLEKKYNKQGLVKSFDTEKFAEENKLSIQEAARELRYNWFEEIKKELSVINHPSSSIYIVTAHHADDNIETVLLKLFRGTGLKGLTGIKPFDKQRALIRPLLFAKRNEIIQYAKENDLQWVEDSSNSSDKYARNFVRNELLPLAKKHFNNIENNLLNNIERFIEIEEVYNEAILQQKQKLIEVKGNEIHIPVLKLKKTNSLKTIVWEIIKAFNFYSAQIEEVIKLFDANNAAYVQSSSHRIIKNRNWLIIAAHQSEIQQHILIEENDHEIVFNSGKLLIEQIQTSNFKLQTSNNVAYLNKNEIEFPLLLRKWKQGDYFYPLGMKKKKKMSRFFIDLKLSPTEKENAWVIESNKKIIWVVGYRIDDRFKILPSTKEILKISCV